MEESESYKVNRRQWMQFLVVMFSISMMPVMLFIAVHILIPYEDKIYSAPVMETKPVPYETLIVSPTDVLLISDTNDTLHLEMICANNLAVEWLIIVKQTN